MTNTDHKRNQRSRRGKGGRPSKKVKRQYVMTLRLTDTERFLIEDKARRAGMRSSEWFRRAAKRASVVARISPEDQRQLRMLAGLANNLNQLVRLAHTDGLLIVQKTCREILRKIDEQLTSLNNDRESNHR